MSNIKIGRFSAREDVWIPKAGMKRGYASERPPFETPAECELTFDTSMRVLFIRHIHDEREPATIVPLENISFMREHVQEAPTALAVQVLEATEQQAPKPRGKAGKIVIDEGE